MSMPLLFELAQDRAASVRVVVSRALADWFVNGQGSGAVRQDRSDVVRNTEDVINEATTFPDLMPAVPINRLANPGPPRRRLRQ